MICFCGDGEKAEWLIMKWFLFSFFLLFPAFSTPKDENSDGKFHICFFELDNTVTSKNFKNQIKQSEDISSCKKRQEFSSTNTVVHCYQPNPQNERGAGAFKRMIQEVSALGDRCDGLVISGHHTGDWYGKVGGIKLKDMEDLSCDPKHRDWFSNIKALWLDGCNTVTDNILKSDSTRVPTPDSETARVLGKDYVEKNKEIKRGAIVGMSQAYTASLDKNTPLSSRYLRMFPHTQIYGYNGSAPTGDQKYQDSYIVNHLSLIGQALQVEEDKNKENQTIDHIKRALPAIVLFDPCDDVIMSTWEEATKGRAVTEAIENQDYNRAYRLGCNLTLAKQLLNNPTKENQEALAEYIKNLQEEEGVEIKQELLDLANEILNNPNSEKAVKLAKGLLLDSLDEITKLDTSVKEEDKTYTHFLFNNIYDTWKTAQKYKTKDSNFYKQAQKKLQAGNFQTSLKERVVSNQTSSLRKGDYIKFYMEVNELKLSEAPGFISNGINDLVNKAENIFEGLKSPRQTNIPAESRRALAVSVVDQLFQYGLLTEEQITAFVNNEKLFPKERKNTFITEVELKLKLSDVDKEKELRKDWADGKIVSNIKPSVLHTLSRKYFREPSPNLTALGEVVEGMDLRNGTERQIFLDAMYSRFSEYTQEQNEEFIVEYSKSSDNKNLKQLLLLYSYSNFQNDGSKRHKEVCKQLGVEHVASIDLSHLCGSN